MTQSLSARLLTTLGLAILSLGAASMACAADVRNSRVISDRTVTGLAFPESVAYDSFRKLLYVSQFGGDTLQPTEKDGKGKISKLSLNGNMLDEHFLPAPGGEPLNKPKGIWVQGTRLWVTDIDVVWVFDLRTRQGRKLALPGARFANDPAVQGNALFVSDNQGNQLFRIEPADFLYARSAPKVTRVLVDHSINPNGIYPGNKGSLLAVGFLSDKDARGIYSISARGELKQLSENIGRLDGVYLQKDGTILATDWDTGTLFSWSQKRGKQTLASGFKGPADFCVVPGARGGYTVVVPDLVKSELRLIRFAR